MKAQPLADRVFVRPSKTETTTESGIIIPDVAIEKPSKGVVISVGIGYPEKPMELKEGDNVMFQIGAGIPMEIQGENILVIRESEIICTI
jgi:chaperonin GroES